MTALLIFVQYLNLPVRFRGKVGKGFAVLYDGIDIVHREGEEAEGCFTYRRIRCN